MRPGREYGPRALRWPAFLPPLNAGSSLFATKGPDAQFIALVEMEEPIGWYIVYQP